MSRQVLEAAWRWREGQGWLAGESPLRLFEGPGEAPLRTPLASVAIDRFGPHAWVTAWEKDVPEALVRDFLVGKGFVSGVVLERPVGKLPSESRVLFGQPPTEPFEVTEHPHRSSRGLKFWIRMLGVRHPGLFLDHAPLRRDLLEGLARGRVANLFAYTGSLSVAAALGGADEVVTVDLSKATLDWAQTNAELNGCADRAKVVAADALDWLPRVAKKGELFDAVLLDPPSFSRSKKRTFSTDRDLVELHEAAARALKPGGLLVTSINSAKVSRAAFEKQIQQALHKAKREARVLAEVAQPETFPAPLKTGGYLKGWVLKLG